MAKPKTRIISAAECEMVAPEFAPDGRITRAINNSYGYYMARGRKISKVQIKDARWLVETKNGNHRYFPIDIYKSREDVEKGENAIRECSVEDVVFFKISDDSIVEGKVVDRAWYCKAGKTATYIQRLYVSEGYVERRYNKDVRKKKELESIQAEIDRLAALKREMRQRPVSTF